MVRIRTLAQEALSWTFLEANQRLMWASVLEFDAVPIQELPPWFLERQNLTRRDMGVDLLSLDGRKAILCLTGKDEAASHVAIKRFIRTAGFVCKADEYLLVTAGSCKLGKVSRRWLQQHSAQLKTLSPQNKFQPGNALTASSVLEADRMADPSLRPCQQACLDACARGARVIEMACGTGKTRVMRELAKNFSGKVHVM
ncbi:Ken-052 [Symbiodinium pilosum]|uniref:Ken-052 protein n=1 Tax=Symbiodinium pilosum TaxID=2952 RepID=A0A812XDM9_SYMPI|nr:Ken-052 [Symbiodinium pilosum]